MPEGDGTKYGKYVMSDLLMPESKQKIDADYRKYARRILWMDDDGRRRHLPHEHGLVSQRRSRRWRTRPHIHDTDEIIGFFGSDPENPNDLNGEVEIWLEDEKHVIDRTTMIFVPAGWCIALSVLNRVDKPIFHFTTVNGGQYVVRSRERCPRGSDSLGACWTPTRPSPVPPGSARPCR